MYKFIISVCCIIVLSLSYFTIIDTSKLDHYFMIKSVENNLKDIVRDPQSLYLRNVNINSYNNVICGEFNAKNGMGGYNDSHTFIAIPSDDKGFLFSDSVRIMDIDNFYSYIKVDRDSMYFWFMDNPKDHEDMKNFIIYYRSFCHGKSKIYNAHLSDKK